MDFIERIFGISPDGGSGALEAVYLVVIAAIVVTVWWRKRGILRWRKKPNT